MRSIRLKPLADFLGLRYRLIWAQARLRNGKIALFVAGYLLLCPVILVMAFGGIGTALASIRTGTGEALARILLIICYSSTAVAGVVLGIGMNSVFSDKVLRRYPISATERFATRHISGCLEPLWIVVFALYCGLAIGFSLIDDACPWIVLPVALLLMLSNYLLTRTLTTLVDRILATRIGPFLLVVVIGVFAAFPAFTGFYFSRNVGRSIGEPALLRFTPPFAGAACLTETAFFPATGWLLCILVWCIALAAVLSQLDRLPTPSRTTEISHVSWNNFYDRAAGLFGLELAPLVGKILRYYFRSPQMRYSYPIVAFSMLMTFVDRQRCFSTAFGMISIAGSMCMGAMILNVFGFDGSGFHRYYLLPIQRSRVFYATAIVPLILSAFIIPFSLAIWILFAPIHIEAQMVVMLLSCGFGSLFLFQALGLWSSLLSPRAIPFNSVLGNKLSFSANALMLGSLVICFGLPIIIDHIGTRAVLDHWWIAPLILLATIIIYITTLVAGSVVFSSRREIILSTIEKGC